MYENLPRLAGIEEQCQYDAACQLLNFFSLSEQVDQILLIFQRLHELLLRNASIWILLKLLEKTLKRYGIIKVHTQNPERREIYLYLDEKGTNMLIRKEHIY